MHMADALLSTPVALAMLGLSAAALAGAGRSLRRQPDDRRVPLMGVLGAFVFALQMVNFAIPGTGASGHLGGGLLLAILLGPAAALVTLSSVLVVQALCFGDGGLLALGANLFNLGVLPCLVVYPLVYRPLAGVRSGERPGLRQPLAAVVAALVAAQLGAGGVVLQTGASGIAGLPMAHFAALMLPIHAAIGLAEGLATAALLRFLQHSAPEWLPAPDANSARHAPQRRMIRRSAAATLFTAAVLSAMASPLPDGLEWSLAQAGGPAPALAETEALPASLAGLLGSGLTLLALGGVALALRRWGARAQAPARPE